tara:strand:- start:638 stop:931 length:294 start_codon:yes stop_codon:yes gene_type:complete
VKFNTELELEIVKDPLPLVKERKLVVAYSLPRATIISRTSPVLFAVIPSAAIAEDVVPAFTVTLFTATKFEDVVFTPKISSPDPLFTCIPYAIKELY